MAGDLTAQIVPYRMADAEEHRYRLSRTMKAIIDEVTNLSLSAGVLSASNVGTAGVGPFKQKTGTDLEFKNINAGSSKITVTDDTGANEIDIDVDEVNVDHDSLLNFVANEHIDHTAVVLTAGAGMTGGGDISSTRILDVIAASNGGILVNADSVQLDINSLAVDTIAAGDFLAFEDITGGLDNKITFTNFESTLNLANQAGTVDISAQTNLVAGTNITLADDTLNVDDAFLFNTGDVGTGVYDFGGATSLEIPNSATPTVNADGEVAIDTTVADFSHGVMKYFGGEEMGVVAMPIAQFTSPTDTHIVTYNGTTDEFQLSAPSAGSAGLVFLASVTASSSSSLDFTSDIDSTFDVYKIFLTNIVVSVLDTEIGLRVSQDGGSTFRTSGIDYQLSGIGRIASAVTVTEGDQQNDRIIFTDRSTNRAVSNVSGRSYSAEVTFYNPSETSLEKVFHCSSVYSTSSGGQNNIVYTSQGTFDLNTSAIDAVQFIPSTGVFVSGVGRLYGISNS